MPVYLELISFQVYVPVGCPGREAVSPSGKTDLGSTARNRLSSRHRFHQVGASLSELGHFQHVCARVYVYVHTWVRVSVCVSACMLVCVQSAQCTFMCVHTCMCALCTRAPSCICGRTCTCLCVRVCLCVCTVHVCICVRFSAPQAHPTHPPMSPVGPAPLPGWLIPGTVKAVVVQTWLPSSGRMEIRASIPHRPREVRPHECSAVHLFT